MKADEARCNEVDDSEQGVTLRMGPNLCCNGLVGDVLSGANAVSGDIIRTAVTVVHSRPYRCSDDINKSTEGEHNSQSLQFIY
jgi:hypothetical protein